MKSNNSANMRPITRLYLILSLVCLAIGLVFLTGIVHPANLPIVHVIFPTGAIFVGLFLVSWMLEKSITEYDSEHTANVARVDAAKGHK